MNDSRFLQSSYGQDYVLTSTTNQFDMGNNYLAPLSPSIFHLNYQKHEFDAQHILSSSPKNQYDFHNVTPYPMNFDQALQKLKEPFQFNSENKENIQTNFDLFQPLEYEKLFEKKIDFSQIGLSSNKKSHKSISELSDQSKKFIQRSIHSNIMQNTPESYKSNSNSRKISENSPQHRSLTSSRKEEIKNFYSDSNQIQRNPVTSSNETIQKRQIQEMNAPQSSEHQPNTYSTDEMNLESIEEAQNIENERDYQEVPSFNERQEVIDYFLTEEDDPNEQNNSEQGIQVLSELKSELNSLINGSVQNSQTSSNNVSKHERTLQEIRSFGIGSNTESAVSKRCSNACQQLASKLEQLKNNIFKLHSKISKSNDSTQKVTNIDSQPSKYEYKAESIEKRRKQIRKQPQIYFKPIQKEQNSKKLIYPDSQIIFSSNDGQFVDFNDQFSKILGQSYHQHTESNHHTTSKYLPQQSPTSQSLRKSSPSNKMKKSRILNNNLNSQFGTQNKEIESQTDKFETSSKKTPMKIQIEKQAFKMSYPKFNDFQNEHNYQSDEDRQQSVNLGNSNLSSTSTETFMLQELNNKFNSRFNQFFQFNN